MIVPIFIDDIMLAGTSPAAYDKVVKELKSHFKLCDLGPTNFLLGIHITRDIHNRTISLLQRQYIVNILKHFGMAECKPVLTPIEPSTSLTSEMSPKTNKEVNKMRNIPYIVAVGCCYNPTPLPIVSGSFQYSPASREHSELLEEFLAHGDSRKLFQEPGDHQLPRDGWELTGITRQACNLVYHSLQLHCPLF